jgi:hypothetical protein
MHLNFFYASYKNIRVPLNLYCDIVLVKINADRDETLIHLQIVQTNQDKRAHACCGAALARPLGYKVTNTLNSSISFPQNTSISA